MTEQYMDWLLAKPNEREVEESALRLLMRGSVMPCNETHRMLALVVARELSPRQCQFVMMYYVDRMNMETIAEICHVNVSTVSRTLERARKKIRQCLKYGGLRLLKESLG